jgi:hypothetical protein
MTIQIPKTDARPMDSESMPHLVDGDTCRQTEIAVSVFCGRVPENVSSQTKTGPVYHPLRRHRKVGLYASLCLLSTDLPKTEWVGA